MAYESQMIAILEERLAVVLRHQANLDADAGELIHKEHAQHVARIKRKINKMKKELAA